MNKSFLTLLVLLSLTPFLVQCASQDEVRTLSYQLRAVNKKLEDMQANTVDKMQKKQASSAGQLTEMQQELLALKGELETTAMTNRQLQEQNKELETSLQEIVSKQSSETDIKITQLNEQLKQQQDSVASLQAARALEAERKARAAAEAADAARLKVKMASSNQGIAQIQAQRKKQLKRQEPASVKQNTAATTTVSEEPKPTAEPVSPEDTSSAVSAASVTEQAPKTAQESPVANATPTDDLFNQAQKKYEAGNYQNAYEMFESYIDKNGSSTNAIQARYMMGECLYQQKEYDQAILQYQKIIASQPKHAKTPAALLKQGMAFEQLSDKDTAKIIYQKIISSYGSSPEAGQAKSKLSSL
ncbi:MAG: tol-pal system protein YbgF [Proteobacteria bacterium]|nr:tol-pal system protein YbgF [Pseudomonadota bacterium]MBU4327024.1 tol-pal system protein YbgF [Pseudomonadota bacterium]